MTTGAFPRLDLFPEATQPLPLDSLAVLELKTRMAALQQQIKALQELKAIEDTDRMNWIEKNPVSLRRYNDGNWFTDADNSNPERSARQAIDRAILIERAMKHKGKHGVYTDEKGKPEIWNKGVKVIAQE